MNFAIRLSIMLAVLFGLWGNISASVSDEDILNLQYMLRVLPGTYPDMQLQIARLIAHYKYRTGNVNFAELNGYIFRLREMLLVHPGTDVYTNSQITKQIYNMCKEEDTDGRCLIGIGDLIIEARNRNWIEKYIREH
ncbi:uncharacterized protein LOC108042017 [Drosophila rhopaloa]|uniref:Uncharacterized protein LOC108042017 n=1 Tax=Drosophila rhopaloa TaxID=1041015 RepID=A0A6P4EGC9_DRORH|nr:uncharacterized protein LOC108042017 [Drosophila rhopaloa]